MPENKPLRLALPKGRMQEGVSRLLSEAGIQVRTGKRGYRPVVSLPDTETKLLKPQNIVEMLHHGSRDVGFAGADWVAELGAELVELMDTGLDPVRVVAAVPEERVGDTGFFQGPLIVATEYARLASDWVKRCGYDAEVLRTYGATEVFPPEDADLIVDNTATGSTLAANNLEIIDEIMTSSTRLYASPRAMEDPARKAQIDDIVLLLRSVIEARGRVMLEINVDRNSLDAIVAILPCMRLPTVSQLHGEAGFAVKAAVPREMLPQLIPEIRNRGGTDIIVTSMSQLVP